MLLAVIADGDGHSEAHIAAETIIATVFETVEHSKTRRLSEVIVRALEAGHHAIQNSGSRVAASVIAIRQNYVHIAHAGHTSVFHVRKGETIPLTSTNRQFLGGPETPRVETNGMALKPGDSIVLASDGLAEMGAGDGKAHVSPAEIATYVEGNAPREAARHLVSLAMGRDVEDNVSVAVIQPHKRSLGRSRSLRIGALTVVLAVILGGIVLVQSLYPREPEVVTTDFGYAVLLSGSANMQSVDGESVGVSRLGTIPPESSLIALEDTRLVLESAGSLTPELPPITVYISGGSQIQLKQIDSHRYSPEEPQFNRALEISLPVALGQILIFRESGSRAVQVPLTDGIAEIVSAGRALLAVDVSSGRVSVSCLAGNCQIEPSAGETVAIPPGYTISLYPGSAGIPSTVDDEAISFWDELCAGCLSNP